MLSVVMLNVVMLNVIHYAECRYDECRYADCHYAECRYAKCHYAECHYAKCRYAECHHAECRYAECRGAVGWTLNILAQIGVPHFFAFFVSTKSVKSFKFKVSANNDPSTRRRDIRRNDTLLSDARRNHERKRIVQQIEKV